MRVGGSILKFVFLLEKKKKSMGKKKIQWRRKRGEEGKIICNFQIDSLAETECSVRRYLS